MSTSYRPGLKQLILEPPQTITPSRDKSYSLDHPTSSRDKSYRLDHPTPSRDKSYRLDRLHPTP